MDHAVGEAFGGGELPEFGFGGAEGFPGFGTGGAGVRLYGEEGEEEDEKQGGWFECLHADCCSGYGLPIYESGISDL